MLIGLSLLVVKVEMLFLHGLLGVELLLIDFKNLGFSVAHGYWSARFYLSSNIVDLVLGHLLSLWLEKLALKLKPFIVSWLLLRGIILVNLSLEKLVLVS